MSGSALAEFMQNGPTWLVGAILLIGSLSFLIKTACSGRAEILREKIPRQSGDRVKVIELQLKDKQTKRRDKHRRRP